MSELSEQNEMLVQTIEELENDSNDKIASLENKLVNTELFLKVIIIFYFEVNVTASIFTHTVKSV